MATLSVQSVSTAGVAPTYASATSGGDQFSNDGKTTIHVKASAAPVTVTIASQRVCDQGSTHNKTVVVSSTGEQMIGPFDTNRYNDTNNRVQLTYSQVTGVTIGVFQDT